MDCYIKRRFYMSHKPQPHSPPHPLDHYCVDDEEEGEGASEVLVTDDDGDGDKGWLWRVKVYIVALWPDAFIVPSGRLTVRH